MCNILEIWNIFKVHLSRFEMCDRRLGVLYNTYSIVIWNPKLHKGWKVDKIRGDRVRVENPFSGNDLDIAHQTTDKMWSHSYSQVSIVQTTDVHFVFDTGKLSAY